MKANKLVPMLYIRELEETINFYTNTLGFTCTNKNNEWGGHRWTSAPLRSWWTDQNFWNQAIDSLHTIPGRKYVLLADGSQKAQFTADFAMNYS